jgi:hypothetical protein
MKSQIRSESADLEQSTALACRSSPVIGVLNERLV